MRVQNYNCSVNQLQRMTASDPGVFSEISFDILQDFKQNCSALGEADKLMLHIAHLRILPPKGGSGVGLRSGDYALRLTDLFERYKLDMTNKYHVTREISPDWYS